MSLNWHIGWCLVLVGMLSGAGLGLGFARDDFLGGYGSFRRRLLRLGHIACVALGAGNVLISVATNGSAAGDGYLQAGCWMAAAGAIAMPSVCFLAAWKRGLRHLFAIPVTLLIASVLLIWWRGIP